MTMLERAAADLIERGETEEWERVLPAERARLVRLCLHLTGSADAAEDLAQEALYEACRNAGTLRDPARRGQWLSGIARNVCRQWHKQRHREVVGRVLVSGEAARAEEALADEFDVEVELERAELVRLLDRALGLLTPDARRVLYERYVAELPQAETALRLGLSEGAVAMKLQRGKVALRRVLSSELHAEASAYGLALLGDDGWKETSLWCARCGARRVLGRWTEAQTHLSLRCPACSPDPHDDSRFATHCPLPPLLTQGARVTGARSFKPAFEKLRDWNEEQWSRIEDGAMPCPGCGAMTCILTEVPEDVPWRGRPGFSSMYRRCARCGSTAHSGIDKLRRE